MCDNSLCWRRYVQVRVFIKRDLSTSALKQSLKRRNVRAEKEKNIPYPWIIADLYVLSGRNEY